MDDLKMKQDFFVQTNCVGYKEYLRPSGIMDLLQDIAGLHAKKLNIGYHDLLNKNLIWVVLYTRVDVVGKLPKYSDIVSVETWPKKPLPLEHEREYRMLDSNGNTILTALSKWVILDSNTHRLRKACEVSIEGNFYTNTIYNEKLPRRLNNSRDLYEKEIDYKVRLSDLDHNGHMNNARYFDMIYELNTINDKKIKTIEISFVSEAHYNDLIHIGYYHIDNTHNFIGYVNNEICFEARFILEE